MRQIIVKESKRDDQEIQEDGSTEITEEINSEDANRVQYQLVKDYARDYAWRRLVF